jgi:hypothetical protein
MVTNDSYARLVIEKTMNAIESNPDYCIAYIKSAIEAAASHAATSVDITDNDVKDIQKVGGTIKQYFMYNGFDVKFLSEDKKIVISWKMEKPKPLLNSYPVNYI